MSARRIPGYTHHKGSGQARVRYKGKSIYLGPYGSPESYEKYEEFRREWFLREGVDGITLTIDDLCLLYLQFAEGYYQKNGEITREVANIRAALRPLIARFGTTRAREFGPKALREMRDGLIGQPDPRIKSEKKRPITRQYINSILKKIRRMFQWAAAEELVPITIYQALKAVPGLKKNRSEAREAEPIKPVADADIDAAIPHMAPPVAAMVELQRLTGMRPNEVVALRPANITYRTDGLWTYRPAQHKNDHHDIERIVFIGPKAQEFLRPWLERESEAFCFTPKEAVAHLQRIKRMRRKTKVQPSQEDRTKPDPKRQPGEKYTAGTYRQAIARACKNAKISAWSPNQIRHQYGTMVRQKFGLEAAQVTLGHAKADVTQIYSERDLALAAKIVREVG